MEILILGIILFILFLEPKRREYRTSGYKEASGKTMMEVFRDKGLYGEYQTFLTLEKLDGYHKLLTNVYIPKEDGTTTEIDLIMIAETGVYVFESKNYSGWIFGNNRQKEWVQTLPGGKKYSFYNPVWQNNGHIKALESVVKMNHPKLFKSYIIFSERCELKNVEVYKEEVEVIKRNQLREFLEKDLRRREEIMTTWTVDGLYYHLSQYALQKDDVKVKHIEGLRRRKENP